jgi:hypothetical protein
MSKLGCPVQNGLPPCGRMCGGGWPGTKIDDEAMRKALANPNFDPQKLGCGPLIDQVNQFKKER